MARDVAQRKQLRFSPKLLSIGLCCGALWFVEMLYIPGADALQLIKSNTALLQGGICITIPLPDVKGIA